MLISKKLIDFFLKDVVSLSLLVDAVEAYGADVNSVEHIFKISIARVQKVDFVIGKTSFLCQLEVPKRKQIIKEVVTLEKLKVGEEVLVKRTIVPSLEM